MTILYPSLCAIAAATVLSGCMPVPNSASQAPLYEPVTAVQPVAPVAASGISGLQERKPDLCGAQKYSSSVSQPGSVIPTLGITKDFRVVEFRGIEPQEYDPNRIVFRLDAAGTITNVDCG